MHQHRVRSIVSQKSWPLIAKSSVLVGITFGWMASAAIADERVSTKSVATAGLTATLQGKLLKLPAPRDGAENAISLHSQRGDILLFLGRFEEAVTEYQGMVEIDPAVDASHWRLGIALFLANQPQTAAAQFDKYHSYDQVDRENGIWRYLSHYRAYGPEKARKELLRYQKGDREPFPAVYKLFDRSLTPAEALARITDDLSDSEREKRLFYTHLYIGLHAVVQGNKELSKKHLTAATQNSWPQTAGFGPMYMWHVGRVQLAMLE